MRVLVACEFSGVVRDAFIARGHDAISCDLLPSDRPGPHIEGDVLQHFASAPKYDLMIAFPPCTYLCSSGLHWNRRRPERAQQTEDALRFVYALMTCANAERVAIENPVGCISTRIAKPDQIIQPWQFGHEETKATCLWLRGLPKLVPTNVVARRDRNLTPSGQNKYGPSADRWRKRSLTYQGIAEAMAEQWGRI